MKKPDKQSAREAMRFVLVGFTATAVHYGVYWLLHRFMDVTVAYTAGYLVSFVLNYVLSARFTFKKGTTVKNGLGFCAAHAFNYVLQVCLLNLFIRLGVPAALAPVPVYCIAVPVNFLVVRSVFRKLK